MAISRVPVWQGLVNGLNQLIVQFGQPVTIQTRSISSPVLGSVDFDELFVNKMQITGAWDTNDKSVVAFDGVTVEDTRTHILYTEYTDQIIDTDWVYYDGVAGGIGPGPRRFSIESIEDIGEIGGVLRLNLKVRGLEEHEATKA